MHSIVHILRASLRLSIAVVIGVFLILLRYIIKTPQLLTSKIAGEARFYTWHGNKVFFQVAGPQDAPPLVLVHTPEIGGSAYEMRKLVPGLARRYRVYVPDLPGFGLSDRPAQLYRANTYQAFLQNFLSEVVRQPTTLLASGLSAQFCLALAHNSPEMVQGLVLLTSLSHLQSAQSPVSAQATTILHTGIGALSSYAFLTRRPILRRVIAWQHQQEPEEVRIDELDYFYASAHQPGAEYAACAWLAGDLQSQLPQHPPRCPILLLQGTRYSTEADRSNTLGELVNIEGAGLRVHEERPELTLEKILRWLEIERTPISQTLTESTTEPEEEKISEEQENLQPLATSDVQKEISLSEASELNIEAYCVKCKQKRTMLHPQQTTTKNGRRAMVGSCPICSTRLFRFI